jgi:hypothetical protein
MGMGPVIFASLFSLFSRSESKLPFFPGKSLTERCFSYHNLSCSISCRCCKSLCLRHACVQQDQGIFSSRLCISLVSPLLLAGAPFICGSVLCFIGLIVALTIRRTDVKKSEVLEALTTPLLNGEPLYLCCRVSALPYSKAKTKPDVREHVLRGAVVAAAAGAGDAGLNKGLARTDVDIEAALEKIPRMPEPALDPCLPVSVGEATMQRGSSAPAGCMAEGEPVTDAISLPVASNVPAQPVQAAQEGAQARLGAPGVVYACGEARYAITSGKASPSQLPSCSGAIPDHSLTTLAGTAASEEAGAGPAILAGKAVRHCQRQFQEVNASPDSTDVGPSLACEPAFCWNMLDECRAAGSKGDHLSQKSRVANLRLAVVLV